MERVVVAYANDGARHRIVRLLESGGISPAGSFASGAEVIRAVRKLGGAMVVCGFRLRDMTAGELAANLLQDAAVLVVSSAVNLDLCEGENLCKLPTPIRPSDFFATLDLLLRQPLPGIAGLG